MKKRIISFLLVLVMLFSCLSLNIFAAEEDPNNAGEEPVLTEAEKYQQYGIGLDGKSNLSAKDFAALAEANGATVKINTDFTTLPAELAIKTGSGYTTDIITKVTEGEGENANTYYKWRGDASAPNSHYMRYDPNSANQAAMKKDFRNGTSNVKGASYVLTFDFVYYGNWPENEIDNDVLGWFFDWRGITNDDLGGAAQSSISFRVLEKDNSLRLWNAGTNYDTKFVFTPGEWVQLSFWHTPKGIDDIEGTADDNMYHVYANGEYVASCTAVTTPTDYTWTEGDNKYNYNSATDFVFARLDFLRIANKMDNNDLYAADNVRFYYGDILECKHDWSYSHTHDVETKTNALTAECAWCGKTETATLSMVKSGNLTKDELTAAAGEENIRINTEFSAGKGEPTTTTDKATVYKDFQGTSNLTLNDLKAYDIIQVVDSNGDYYLHWECGDSTLDKGATNAYGEKLSYEEPGTTSAGIKAELSENGIDNLGQAYSITFDFMHYGNITGSNAPSPWIIDSLLSYTGDLGDEKTSNDSVTANPFLRLRAAGEIRLNNNGANYDTNYKLTANEWYRITFYHTPRGVDGIRGTADDNTYHVFVDGKRLTEKAGLPAVASSVDYTYNGVSYNSALDFKLHKFDIGNVARLANIDIFALDNLRFYYGTFQECAHTDTNGNSCVENGKCTSCGKTMTSHCDLCARDIEFSGLALDSEVALTDMNIELGAEISMNVYLELSEAAKADANTLVRLTGADGKRIAEYALKDLEESEKAPGRYKATLPLRSIDMAKDVTVEIVGDNADYSTTYTTSVAEYLEELIEESQSEKVVALAKATLNYGAYAQLYFAEYKETPEIAENLANASLSDADKNAIDAVESGDLTGDRISQTITGAGIQVTGASLILTSQTKMKLYFTATDSATVQVVKKADDGTLEPLKTLNKYESEEEGEYYVIIDGVNPAGLNDKVTLVISDGTNGSTVSFSVLSCVDAILFTEANAPDTMSDTLVDLAKAIYLYNDAADNYPQAEG